MVSFNYKRLVIATITVLIVSGCTFEPTEEAAWRTSADSVEPENIALGSDLSVDEEAGQESTTLNDAMRQVPQTKSGPASYETARF